MLFNLLGGFSSKTDFIVSLITLLLRIPAVLLALSLHESAHGYIANKMGDPTAKNLGRITITPAKHLDPIGTISMLLFGIGWAKPVPVNSRNFKKPRKGMACTAAAGPLVNLLLGFLSLAGLIFGTKIFLSANSDNMQLQALFSFFKAEYGSSYTSLLYVFLLNVVLNLSSGLKIVALLLYFLYISAMLNFMLAIFNLIPLPPFDGSRIAYVFLPAKYYFGVMKYERYIMIAFLIFFWFGSSFFSGAFEWLVNLLFRTMGWIL